MNSEDQPRSETVNPHVRRIAYMNLIEELEPVTESFAAEVVAVAGDSLPNLAEDDKLRLLEGALTEWLAGMAVDLALEIDGGSSLRDDALARLQANLGEGTVRLASNGQDIVLSPKAVRQLPPLFELAAAVEEFNMFDEEFVPQDADNDAVVALKRSAGVMRRLWTAARAAGVA